jgi:tRNA(Ile)-lysidine synthase
MTETSSFENRLLQSWPPHKWRGKVVVLAVSGGPDSVALMRGIERLNAACDPPARLIVAHFHHGWRRGSADEDAQFVRELAEQFHLPYREGRGTAPTPDAGHHGMGPEAIARQQRYRFLLEIAHHTGARFVATGHSADDQVETVLHRLVRGTGLRGLRGIPRSRLLSPDVALIRPLLDCPRSVIESYLAELGQGACHDPTNDSARYTRNRLRHELLPLLRQHYNPLIDEALLRLAAIAEEVSLWTGEATEQVWQQCVRLPTVPGGSTKCVLGEVSAVTAPPPGVGPKGWQVAVLREPLRQYPKYLVQELLVEIWRRQDWPRRQLDSQSVANIAAMFLAAPDSVARRQAPGSVDIQLDDEVAWLRRLSGPSPSGGAAAGPF